MSDTPESLSLTSEQSWFIEALTQKPPGMLTQADIQQILCTKAKQLWIEITCFVHESIPGHETMPGPPGMVHHTVIKTLIDAGTVAWSNFL